MRQDLLRAIESMKSGDVQSAAANLRELVDDPTLDDHARAIAYVWLAETSADRDFKIRCLQRALQAEPLNARVRGMLDRLLTETVAQPSGRLQLQASPAVVGVSGGPNGRGSGIFLTRAGLVATTAYVTGYAPTITVVLDNDNQVTGVVARRFPESDLALIDVPVEVDGADEAAFPALITEGELVFVLAISGVKRGATVGQVGVGAQSQWLLLNLRRELLPDAGGNPVHDGEGKLAGMLTRNADYESGCLCALAIEQIHSLAEQYEQERRLLPDARICVGCGSLTRAMRYGGRFCETCGATPGGEVETQAPNPERLRQLYEGQSEQSCPHCAAAAGFYAGRCLRCGREILQRLAQ